MLHIQNFINVYLAMKLGYSKTETSIRYDTPHILANTYPRSIIINYFDFLKKILFDTYWILRIYTKILIRYFLEKMKGKK